MKILGNITSAQDSKIDKAMEVPISTPPPPLKVLAKKKPNKCPKKRTEVTRDILGYVQNHDSTVKRAMAPTGLRFGKLLRGDAEEKRKDLKKIIHSRASFGKISVFN